MTTTRALRVKRRRAKKELNRLRSQPQTFKEHLIELRRRLFYIAVCVICAAVGSFAIEHTVIDVLLRPSNGQQFIYTSPMGGINFLFSIGLSVGFIISIPVIVYQLLKFLEPMLKIQSGRFIMKVAATSGILALVGIIFGYFAGLPSALHFLLNTFESAQIKPLVTIQSYMSFVMMYMVGSAMLLQMPLLLLVGNRIKPLKPRQLFKHQKWAILFAVVGAFIIYPTPNVIAQSIVIVPVVLSYYFGIGMVWLVNYRSVRRLPQNVKNLIDQDRQAQAARHASARRGIKLRGEPIAEADEYIEAEAS